MNRALAIAAMLFFFELAAFLIIVPWSSLWESNLLFGYAPAARYLLLHDGVRTGVSGLGVLNLIIGISEARSYLRARKR